MQAREAVPALSNPPEVTRSDRPAQARTTHALCEQLVGGRNVSRPDVRAAHPPRVQGSVAVGASSVACSLPSFQSLTASSMPSPHSGSFLRLTRARQQSPLLS